MTLVADAHSTGGGPKPVAEANTALAVVADVVPTDQVSFAPGG